ncbi:PepSY domain-containing protein [Ureibacillus sinduriensis]|uniref:PepSY domain-containing protein n=1 Tax=Ureibacillus sinduriensis BLB-1 = JCM 15800 TaxID=1384057 RepID=A0A0A3I1X5_9BACL|nr:PepSY domain-containing protein [Ureibacillus sinduriensis]KGR76663.1 hypothetical protein CD33_05750 [Ureibacillus sinduriensis BLB-1 = JCM 15800]
MLKKLIFTGSTLLLLTACNNSEQSTNNSGTVQPTKEEVNMEAGKVEESPTSEKSADITKVTMSLQDAANIFQESYPEAAIHSVDLDTSFGKYEYEVTGQDASKEYELTIDAETKKVLKEETDTETEREGTLDFSIIIEPSAAIKSASSVRETNELLPESWSLDEENGIHIYTVNFEKGGSEVEVEVNAESGEILNVEIDD